MKQRVTNVATNSSKKYVGLPICNRSDFIEFGLHCPKFDKLFRSYKLSHGNRRKAPSVDRINNKKGYTLDNMQFLSVPDNRRKASIPRWVKLKDSITGRIHSFRTTREASNFLGHLHPIKATRKSFFRMKPATTRQSRLASGLSVNVRTNKKYINVSDLKLRPGKKAK